MKRSAITRKTPLARGKPLERTSSLKRTAAPKRRTRVRPTNPERKAETFARNFGPRGEAVRAMPCLCARGPWSLRCGQPAEAAHARARGMGGAKGDRRDLVPLSRKHHDEAGEARTSQRAAFELRHGLDLFAEADRIAAELDARGLP
jgi:hypothetical protein